MRHPTARAQADPVPLLRLSAAIIINDPLSG